MSKSFFNERVKVTALFSHGVNVQAVCRSLENCCIFTEVYESICPFYWRIAIYSQALMHLCLFLTGAAIQAFPPGNSSNLRMYTKEGLQKRIRHPCALFQSRMSVNTCVQTLLDLFDRYTTAYTLHGRHPTETKFVHTNIPCCRAGKLHASKLSFSCFVHGMCATFPSSHIR
jgi:hypothetical protein